MGPLVLVVSLLLCLRHVTAQSVNTYQLHDASGTMLLAASQTCFDAYNANVSCSSRIGDLYGSMFPDLDVDSLSQLCTADCYRSLLEHRANVSTSCATSGGYLDEADDTLWAVTALDDRAIHGYNLTCLVRSDGQYCNTWFQSIVDSTTPADCDDCYLRTVQLQVNSPFEGSNKDLKSIYQTLTSSCQSTGYATITPTTVMISSAIATSTCSGTPYVVQATDTAFSVSLAQGVSTDALLSDNPLSWNVTEFPTAGSLCIQNKCKVYIVKNSDTCLGIARANSVTYAELTSWNTNINGLCSNLPNLVDQTLCLSNPLGDYTVVTNTASSPTMVTTAAPVPTQLEPNMTTYCGRYYQVQANDDCGTVSLNFGITLADFYFLNPGINENCTNLWYDYSVCVQPVGTITTYPNHPDAPRTMSEMVPDATTAPLPWVDPFDDSTSTNIIIPLANETRIDCWEYTWWNSSDTEVYDAGNCWTAAWINGITREQLALWNPSIDTNDYNATTKNYNYPCTLQPSQSYCVVLASPTPIVPALRVPPSPRAAGEIQSCTFWLPAFADLDCLSMISNINLDMATFYAMNPSVGSDCSSLSAGTYYCISTNSDGTSGTTTQADDGSSPSTVSPPPSTTTGNSVATPTPIQAGMTTSCTTFHQVVPGDGCRGIANAAGIDLSTQFYVWNPAVGTDCSSLWLHYYVCVGVSSSTPAPTTPATPATTTPAAVMTPTPYPANMAAGCTTFYKAKSGDYCYLIISQFGISQADFVAWNPDVGSDCWSIWVDYHYCTGH